MDAKTQRNLINYGGLKFNFGEVNSDHTKAVKEVCDILKSQNVDESIIKDLQFKFKIKELPKYNLVESPFVKYCMDEGVAVMEQGNVTVKENGETKLYPVVVVCEDIRKLNKIFDNIFKSGILAAEQIKK